LYEEGAVVLTGVFNYTDSAIDCQTSPGMHFVLGYSLTGDTLTVNPGQATPDDFVGQWKKIGTPAVDTTNPLVGIWKSKTDEGFSFYKFYPDGKGWTCDANSDLTNMNAVGNVSYNLDTSKLNIAWIENGKIITLTTDVSFELNGDTLTRGKFVFERQ
jgi:hypothetical protein